MTRRLRFVAFDHPLVIAQLFLLEDFLQIVVQIVELDVLLFDVCENLVLAILDFDERLVVLADLPARMLEACIQFVA